MIKRKGFTLIEIMLFLAVTAALFIGVAAGMQNSIFQQRYNDSTQNFLEFMRSIYSKVTNPQSPGDGRSDEAMYGKLVVFGEKTDINGDAINQVEDGTVVFVYDVIGLADTISGGLGTGGTKEMLNGLRVNVVRISKDNSGNTTAELVSPEKYIPHWGAAIESTSNTSNNAFAGSILVVRHPRSGTVNTLFYGKTIDVNKEYNDAAIANDYAGLENLLIDKLKSADPTDVSKSNPADVFESQEIDFCVNPNGLGVSLVGVPRQNIRIVKNARNASGVELIDLDGGDNHCVQ